MKVQLYLFVIVEVKKIISMIHLSYGTENVQMAEKAKLETLEICLFCIMKWLKKP